MNSLLLIDLAYDLHADRLRWADGERLAHAARMARNEHRAVAAETSGAVSRREPARPGHRPEMEAAGR